MKLWAEIGSNHNGNLERCLHMIKLAARQGFDAAKLQLFGKLFADDRATGRPVPREWLDPVASTCGELGLGLVASVFGLDQVEAAAELADVLKVSSYDILRRDLIEAAAGTGKPLVISTGMATEGEIEDALEWAEPTEPVLLHCISAYPTPPEQANLAAIQALRDRFGVPVGWSDHTRSPGVVLRAIHRWGAEIVELHVDLDSYGDEYEAGHCWLPWHLQPVIDLARQPWGVDGDGWIGPSALENEERMQRADPSDGLRPLREAR